MYDRFRLTFKNVIFEGYETLSNKYSILVRLSFNFKNKNELA